MPKSLVKGNYPLKVEAEEGQKTLGNEFEIEALKKLGGSIAIVKGRKLVEAD